MFNATAEQVRELVAKGAIGGWVGFGTDDCRKTYEELSAKGVEFTDSNQEHRRSSQKRRPRTHHGRRFALPLDKTQQCLDLGKRRRGGVAV